MLIDVERIFKRMIMEYKLTRDYSYLSKMLKCISGIMLINRDIGTKLLNDLTMEIINRDNNEFKAELNMTCYDNDDMRSKILIVDFETKYNIFKMVKNDRNTNRYNIFMSLDYSSEIVLFLEACVIEGYVSGTLINYCVQKIKNDFKNINKVYIDYINCGNDSIDFVINDIEKIDTKILCTPNALELIDVVTII